MKLLTDATRVIAKKCQITACSSILLPVAAAIYEHLSQLFCISTQLLQLTWFQRKAHVHQGGLMLWHWSIHNSSKCQMSLVNETSLRYFEKLMSNFLKLIQCPIPFEISSRLGSFLKSLKHILKCTQCMLNNGVFKGPFCKSYPVLKKSSKVKNGGLTCKNVGRRVQNSMETQPWQNL